MVSLAKSPTLRYASVERLRSDIDAHLSGGLVEARKTRRSVNWGVYATKRFVRRYRTPVAASAAAVLALIVGLALATWQWQVAVAAEEQERLAKERTQAIANGLLEEISENVMVLPGALRVREAVSRLALDHLEAMQDDPDWGSDALLLDVALGYERLGDIEAGLRNSRVGDFDAAEAHYARSRELRDQLSEEEAKTLALAQSDKRAGDVLRERDDNAGAADAYTAGLGKLDGLAQVSQDSLEVRLLRAQVNGSLANVLARRGVEADRVTELRTEALAIARSLVAEAPTVEHRLVLGLSLHRLGDMNRRAGIGAEAVELSGEAAGVYRSLFEEDPVNAFLRRRLATALAMHAFALRDSGAAAADVSRVVNEAIFHLRFLAEADPMDALAKENLARALEVAALPIMQSDGATAHAMLTEAMGLHASVAEIEGGADYEDRVLLLSVNRGKASYYARETRRCAQEMVEAMNMASGMIAAGDTRRNVLASYADAAGTAYIAVNMLLDASPEDAEALELGVAVRDRIVADEQAVTALVGDEPTDLQARAVEALAQTRERLERRIAEN